MIVMGIDTGMTTGWALLSEGEIIETGMIEADSHESLQKRVHTNEHGLRAVWIRTTPDITAVEMPQPWGNYKALSSARRGDLHNLFFLVGVIFQASDAQLIKVSTWKGQLSKEVVWRRLCKVYGEKNVPRDGGKFHRADAIGIAHYILIREKKNDMLKKSSTDKT